MSRNTAPAALAALLALCACQQRTTPANDTAPVLPANVADSGESPTPAAPPVTAPPAANESAPESVSADPPVLTPEAERGETGARNVLLSFARAIEQRRFDQAWSLLSAADQRKWTRAQFAALFADLPRPTVAIPDGEIEGAAGSSYYTAPVAVTGTTRDGRPIRIEGQAILRRVNDVDGATPAQLRWHFERLTLEWTH